MQANDEDGWHSPSKLDLQISAIYPNTVQAASQSHPAACVWRLLWALHSNFVYPETFISATREP